MFFCILGIILLNLAIRCIKMRNINYHTISLCVINMLCYVRFLRTLLNAIKKDGFITNEWNRMSMVESLINYKINN